VDYESQLRLERDAAVVRAALEAAGGHLVHRVADSDNAANHDADCGDDPDAPVDPPGLYWAVIQPTDPDSAALFVARIHWTVYPDRAPSVLFATEVDGPTTELRAWPAATGYRPPNDICKPFTAEGQALHPEWATGAQAWPTDGNPFLFVVENLHDDINRVRGARAA
jgi:hypothetical protein